MKQKPMSLPFKGGILRISHLQGTAYATLPRAEIPATAPRWMSPVSDQTLAVTRDGAAHRMEITL